MIRTLVLCAVTALSSAAVAAQPADPTPALKPVATLDCTATRLGEGPRGTKLACTLDADNSWGKVKFDGVMYGEALYLLAPREINVSWKVMAPTPTLTASQLEGDYDRVSRYALQYPRDNRNVLMGGKGDLIGLELVSPAIEGLEASTFLKLRASP